MPVRPFSTLFATAACLTTAIPATAFAAPARMPPAANLPAVNLYVRARAATAIGDSDAAVRDFTALLAHEPVDTMIVQRAYRQGLLAGDLALAARAAHMLAARGALAPDGRLLLAADAIRARDWAGADAAIAGIEKDRLFAFLVPFLRAWVAWGAGRGDPIALVEQARSSTLAATYLPEQRALLLIALGRTEQGVAALRGPAPGSLDRLPVRLRLILADALGGSGQTQRALAVLDGDDPALAAARARLTAGARLPERIVAPADGVAALLTAVAADFGRQRLAPVALTLARCASFAAPRDAAARLLSAELLASGRQPDLALAALAGVAADDPLATTARAVRIELLARSGDNQAALDAALAAANAPGAAPAAWARVGDVQMTMDRPADAVSAYAKAIAAATAANLPVEVRWPLLLQQADALDRSGNWPAARDALRAALALAPDQPLVLNQLGYSEIAHREDVAAASKLIERASAMRPDDAAITDSLGWSRYLQGQVEAAVPLLEKAAAGNPLEPTINEHLGDAYWASGRLFEARYAWRAALVTADDKDKPRLTAKIDVGLTPETAAP